MNQTRAKRVAQLMQRELGEMLLTEIKDPRVGFVSITHVEVTRDLQQAKIFVSIMGTPEEVKASLEGLKSAQRFLRGEVSRRLGLRMAPELVFIVDSSITESLHIHELLQSLPPRPEVPDEP
ncbi:ribosome-binding factor A [Sulfobacillus acidophilus DSM 10332]|jgi:ribosome-binding factor A|uniref:Ribosome-binding factor A n=1 Tax=Sulfobacillus acidophilus (strain ATCC 700253 / DSM 10332 / NAL) TaxID=679936 RepID=G8U0U0_SULAD|nr:ribosome-binding factor A [Sulfobacillus acidophilus DSM 10332]